MAKSPQPTLPDNIIEVSTAVTYKGETLESKIHIDASEIAARIINEGAEKVNQQIGKTLSTLFNKTSENFSSVVNK